MPTQTLSNATIGQQDPGTGLGSTEPRDPLSAGMIAGADAHASAYHTCSISANWSGPSLTVNAGGASIPLPGSITVQSEAGGDETYDRTWHGDVAVPVSIPQTTVTLESGVNEVYLTVDPTQNNAVALEWGTSVNPSEPRLLLAVADTAATDAFVRNPAPDTDHGTVSAAEIEQFDPTRSSHSPFTTTKYMGDLPSGSTGHLLLTRTDRAHNAVLGRIIGARWTHQRNADIHDIVLNSTDTPSATGSWRVQRGGVQPTSLSLVTVTYEGNEYYAIESATTEHRNYDRGVWFMGYAKEPQDLIATHDATNATNVESSVLEDGIEIFGNSDLTVGGSITAGGKSVVVGDSTYEIQVNGSDGAGIINFRTK